MKTLTQMTLVGMTALSMLGWTAATYAVQGVDPQIKERTISKPGSFADKKSMIGNHKGHNHKGHNHKGDHKGKMIHKGGNQGAAGDGIPGGLER